MCLIIASQDGKLPSDALLEEAYFDNKHGWGVMWAEDGVVRNVKGFQLDTLKKWVTAQEGHPFCVHLRWATHGYIDQNNCHPFKVSRDLQLMHNGVFKNVDCTHKEFSDTWHFTEELKRVLEMWPSMNDHAMHDTLLRYIEGRCGATSKVALMRADGQILIANRSLGLDYQGMWLSNDYSLPENRVYTGYESYGVSYYGSAGFLDRWYGHSTKPQQTTIPIDTPTYTSKHAVHTFIADGEIVDLKEPGKCDYCCTDGEHTLFGWEGMLLCFDCWDWAEKERAMDGKRLTFEDGLDDINRDVPFDTVPV